LIKELEKRCYIKGCKEKGFIFIKSLWFCKEHGEDIDLRIRKEFLKEAPLELVFSIYENSSWRIVIEESEITKDNWINFLDFLDKNDMRYRAERIMKVFH